MPHYKVTFVKTIFEIHHIEAKDEDEAEALSTYRFPDESELSEFSLYEVEEEE